VLLAIVAFPLLLRWERSASGEVSPRRVAGPDR
jgi:hypothetical protein